MVIGTPPVTRCISSWAGSGDLIALGPDARLICRLFCAAFTVMSALMWFSMITSAGTDYRIVLDFNYYGEGLFETVLFPIAAIVGLVGLYAAYTDPVE